VELTVDPLPPTAKSVGSPETSHVWVLQPVQLNEGSPIVPGRRPYSYLAECECPDDCPRDHGNE
jgi:hypothetical protein